MTTEDKLKIDYEATTRYLHSLAESRLKLLAFVPTVTGLALAAYDRIDNPEVAAALGLFGFFVTLGISYYDQRNTTIYDAMQIRAKTLEAYFGFPTSRTTSYNRDNKEYQYKRAGAILDRPQRGLFWLRLSWVPFLKIWHDCGLAFVYSSVLAVWSYVALTSFAQMWVWPSRAGAIGASIIWILVFVHYLVNDTPTDAGKALSEKTHWLLQADAAEFDEMVPPNPTIAADGNRTSYGSAAER